MPSTTNLTETRGYDPTTGETSGSTNISAEDKPIYLGTTDNAQDNRVNTMINEITNANGQGEASSTVMGNIGELVYDAGSWANSGDIAEVKTEVFTPDVIETINTAHTQEEQEAMLAENTAKLEEQQAEGDVFENEEPEWMMYGYSSREEYEARKSSGNKSDILIEAGKTRNSPTQIWTSAKYDDAVKSMQENGFKVEKEFIDQQGGKGYVFSKDGKQYTFYEHSTSNAGPTGKTGNGKNSVAIRFDSPKATTGTVRAVGALTLVMPIIDYNKNKDFYDDLNISISRKLHFLMTGEDPAFCNI